MEYASQRCEEDELDNFFKGQHSRTKNTFEANERLGHMGIIKHHFLIGGNQLEMNIHRNNGCSEA